jgi:hypothetical protein
MNPYKEKWLATQGVDIDALKGSAGWAISKGEKYVHGVKGRSKA